MVGNLLDKLRKLSMHELEWNSPQEIFSRPQKTIDNSWQCVLLRTDILQKTVVGCLRSIMQDFLTCHCMGDVFEYETENITCFPWHSDREVFHCSRSHLDQHGKPLQPNKISKKRRVFLFSFYAGLSLTELVKKQC